MQFLTILFIAVGLAMDAFAVSIASGIALKNLRARNALTIAIFFGFFQAFMPILGWLAGLSLRDFISSVDHWIAFSLLSFIGIKMIWEATRLKEAEERVDGISLNTLFLLSIATSIDALAVGLSFAFLQVSIATPVIIIGVVTFLLSFAGVFIGNRVGHLLENRIEIAGGLILIGIGMKILLEHLQAV